MVVKTLRRTRAAPLASPRRQPRVHRALHQPVDPGEDDRPGRSAATPSGERCSSGCGRRCSGSSATRSSARAGAPAGCGAGHDRRGGRRQRPERARRRDPPRRGGPLRARARGRRRTPAARSRTEELTLPGFRHDTFSAVYPAGAASPVFAPHAARATTASSGCTRAPATRTRCPTGAPPCCPRPRRHGGQPQRAAAQATATAGGRSRPLPGRIRARPRHDAGGLPPVPGRCGCSPRCGSRGTLEFARLLLDARRTRSAARLFEADGARAWLYGVGDARRRAARGAGSAIAARHLNLLGHAVGWPSPRGGAGRLTDALVGYLRALGGELRTGAPVERSRRARPRRRRRDRDRRARGRARW